MKSKSKKIAKVLLAFMLVVSTVIGFNPSAVFAEDIPSASYSLYFNSPNGPNGTSAAPRITFYSGTMYFAVDTLSGSSGVKIVTCAGANVNMSAVQRTSTGTTSFTCTLKNPKDTMAQFNVTLTNDGTSTAYASGRVYRY